MAAASSLLRGSDEVRAAAAAGVMTADLARIDQARQSGHVRHDPPRVTCRDCCIKLDASLDAMLHST